MLGFNRHDMRMMWVFFRMNVRDKYLGSSLGVVWTVANPVFMLTLFTFVFGYLLKVRMPGAEGGLSYAAWLISGYGPWLATSAGLMAASVSVVAGAGLVKNMPFKTELLPITAALTGILPLGVSLTFLAVLLIMDGNAPSWHAMLSVVVVLLQFLLIVSLGFVMSAITVFVRDFVIALPNILMIVLFSTPIFYPLSMTPDFVQKVTVFNPFYIIADGYRQALIYHRAPDVGGLIYVGVLSVVLAFVGLRFFRRYKGYFEARL